ncbi:MAG: DUF1285 domain-containing protein [Roseovarius sp.]
MSDKQITTPSADGIEASARAARNQKGLPPVHSWNPPFCGNLDMRIARDGTWYYQGTPITRPGLVKLFSTILRRDGDDYVLVTPVEKVGITVDDAPFVAVDFEVAGTGAAQTLCFETNVGDHTVASADTPLRIERDPDTHQPAPYVVVRDNLEALIDRKSFYRLIEIGTHHDGWFGLWSSGQFFPIIASDELPAD